MLRFLTTTTNGTLYIPTFRLVTWFCYNNSGSTNSLTLSTSDGINFFGPIFLAGHASVIGSFLDDGMATGNGVTVLASTNFTVITIFYYK